MLELFRLELFREVLEFELQSRGYYGEVKLTRDLSTAKLAIIFPESMNLSLDFLGDIMKATMIEFNISSDIKLEWHTSDFDGDTNTLKGFLFMINDMAKWPDEQLYALYTDFVQIRSTGMLPETAELRRACHNINIDDSLSGMMSVATMAMYELSSRYLQDIGMINRYN